MPAKVVCLCYQCSSENPNGLERHRKTAQRHYAADMELLKNLSISTELRASLDRCVEATLQNLIGLPKNNTDDTNIPSNLSSEGNGTVSK